jgi:SAM-dependent methyltransferase
MSDAARFISSELDDTDRERFTVLLSTLADLRSFIEGRRVLDFGASYGLSLCALLETGAGNVVGVEPDKERVERGLRLLAEMGIDARANLIHVADSRRLPFPDGVFDVVLANAVLEHIPPPRAEYIREMWRLVKRGGHLIVNETPNKYLPRDFHTTGLWLVPWMPQRLARQYAVWRGRWTEQRDWNSSGWHGLGYFELTHAISRFADESPRTRRRHHIFRAFGFSPQILDPYPTFVLHRL